MSSLRQVTLYSKPACGLCDEVKVHLQRLQAEFALTLVEVDITQDPALFRRYQYLIPVMDIDGGVALFPPIDPDDLRSEIAEAFDL